MTRIFLSILASAAVIGVGLYDGLDLPRSARAQDSDTVIRLDQLEHQMRQLTGTIEQLQYRNQQLEQALRRMQDDMDARLQQLAGKAAQAAGQNRVSGVMPSQSASSVPPSQPAVGGRRTDAFDPTLNPNAPGAPRTLGSLPANPAPGNATMPAVNPDAASNVPPINVPGGRSTGAPLDLSANAPRNVAAADNGLPSANAGQVAAVLPPSQTPRDEFDLAYGYLLRKDYASAEDGFRAFLRAFPNDRMAADAQFWLGESMFQRQDYRDAADAFLGVTKNYESSAKAPDALLRLGESLAAIGEKDLACATFGEVGRKYPRASPNVKQGVDREFKRVHC